MYMEKRCLIRTGPAIGTPNASLRAPLYRVLRVTQKLMVDGRLRGKSASQHAVERAFM